MVVDLQATAFHFAPRTIMETNEDGKDVVVGGYEYQIFDTIADKLKYVVFMYECI